MEHLKTFRQQLGVSQKDFATLMGCSPGQLAMAESGLRKLPVSDHVIFLQQYATTTARTAKPPDCYYQPIKVQRQLIACSILQPYFIRYLSGMEVLCKRWGTLL